MPEDLTGRAGFQAEGLCIGESFRGHGNVHPRTAVD